MSNVVVLPTGTNNVHVVLSSTGGGFSVMTDVIVRKVVVEPDIVSTGDMQL